MEGRLFQRGKRKTWYLVFDLPKKPDEKRKQQFVRIGNLPRTQALAKKREILQKVDRGEWVEERADVRVEDFFESWLAAIKHKIEPTTHARYSGLVHRHFVPVIGDLMLRKVTTDDILQIDLGLVERRLSPQTRLHAHRALHTAFTWAVKENSPKLLEKNVVADVKAPKVEQRGVSPFAHKKLKAVLNSVHGTRLEAPVVLATLTGLRRGELLALKWSSVSLEGDEPFIFVAESLQHTRTHGVRFKAPKTRKSLATVPLAPECVELLRRHKVEQDRAKAGPYYSDQDLVFPNPDGAPWPPDSFSVQFGRLVSAAGCKGFRLHDLRHAYATFMLADGVSLKEVSILLRHSSEALTLTTYAHGTVGAGRAAVSSLARSLLGSEVAGSP